MLQFNKARKYVADFETTVFEGQENTEVWAAASVPVWSENVSVFNCIDDFLKFHFSKNHNQIIYFHNLKFDGQFILDYLFKHDFKIACENPINIDSCIYEFQYIKDFKDMPERSFYTVISDLGQWYLIVLMVNGHIIEFRDSLKLLPFSVETIGKGFNTKHKKLSIKYEGVRHAGNSIEKNEIEYIKNDVLVVKEALEQMFNEGHTELTIGACCMKEFKRLCKLNNDPNNPLALALNEYKLIFPELNDIKIDSSIYGSENADEYIRKSYHGGWCYVVKGCEEKVIKHIGCTADVNSLYPSQMHSTSGNKYPFGDPQFWSGSEIPKKAKDKDHFYFIRFKCRFKIKNGMLPFVQIKNSFLYKHNEYLTTSDYYNNGKYYRYLFKNGEKIDSIHTFTMTQTDYEMFLKHYETFNFEILDGCYFRSFCGFFDDYINKYMYIKQHNKGAKRTIAKLFLNNLYGKFASSKNSSFQVPILNDNIVQYFTVPEAEKKAGYIAIGSAVTSYSRRFTISAAQTNFYGPDKDGFKYADTDSIHCTLTPEQLKGVSIHESAFNCWKIENTWDHAVFVRQKTYIEHTISEDMHPCKPYYLIKCAGMNKECKQLLNASLSQDYTQLDISELTPEQLEFIATKRTLADFKPGLEIYGKLLPKKITGGIVLYKTTFKLRRN